jgi:hypothetical protein
MSPHDFQGVASAFDSICGDRMPVLQCLSQCRTDRLRDRGVLEISKFAGHGVGLVEHDDVLAVGELGATVGLDDRDVVPVFAVLAQ